MKKQPTEAVFEPVEPRILFSADGVGAMAVDIAEPMPEEPAIEATLHENDVQTDQNQVQENDSVLGENQLRTELVFVDPNVEGHEELLDDLLSNGHDRNFEIHMLDEGIEDITSALEGIDDVSALHIIAHGDAGEIQIGATTITNDSFENFNDTLTGWSDSLNQDADILFYGCNVAGSDNGQQLLGRIAAATGADIGASDDLTGHVDEGGDWILEYKHGELETEIAISEEAQAEFTGVLDITTGLVGQYTFDTDASDSSGNNNHGTLQGNASIDTTDGTDKIGDAKLSLDGFNDYVDLSSNISSFSGLSQGTISAWIRTTDTGESTIFGLSDEDGGGEVLKFSVEGGQLKWLNINDSGGYVIAYSNASNLNDGNWHHVAVTVGSSGNQMYIDGAAASASYTGGNSSESSFISDISGIDYIDIGSSYYTGSSADFSGLIDEARIYNRAMSSSDITELYNYTGSNDAPVQSSIEGSTLSYTENDGAVSITNSLALSDSDDSNLESAVIQITGNYVNGQDVLNFTNQNGISGSWNASTGTLTLTGSSSVTNYQTALRSITYTNSSEDPNTATRTVSFTVNDGDVDSNTQTRNIDVAFTDEAPSDTYASASAEGGLEINNDGGNDIYLQANDGGALLGGLSSFTFESSFQLDQINNTNTLLSYATSSSQNSMVIEVQNDGDLVLVINGVGTTSFNAIDYIAALGDGEQHTLSLSWDNTNGDVAIYIDGEFVESSTGIGTGITLAGSTSDGSLVFGNEQDSVGGDFDPDQALQGSLYDIRIFNDVRTANEINLSYNSDLPYNEANMLANWQFDSLKTDINGNQTLIDIVSGNNLNVNHATGAGFTTSNPSFNLIVNENAIDGTVVGSVAGVDEERNALIQSLLDADPDLHYNAETNKFYKTTTGAVDRNAANSTATSTNLNFVAGSLPTITSAVENEAIRQLIADTGQSGVWLSGSDSDVADEWRWQDGTQFWQGAADGYSVDGAYTNFSATEPNGGTNATITYLSMQTSGQWKDSSAFLMNTALVIEWNADDVLDVGQALTYYIQSQPEAGAFGINSDTGEIFVADGSKLDYESRSSHTLTIGVADADGGTRAENFTINIKDLVENNNAPTNLSSGIELNTDGGNDAYLYNSDIGLVLNGLSEFTFETTFSSTSLAPDETALISYATSTNDNEILLNFQSDGRLGVAIAGEVFFTTESYSYLFDGEPHSIALSWDNTHGDVAILVDGEIVHTHSSIGEGQTIDGGIANGTIVFGNEQDSLGGAFATNEVFEGTLYDVRIWNEVRSAEEISLNYQNKFDTGSLPTGLIANWQMDGFNGSNEVVDVVSANNLSIGHATGTGFTTSTPVEDLHVNENASNGTSVGFVIPNEIDVHNDLITDGGFLEGDSGSWDPHSQGSTIGDWTVIESWVDHTSSYPSPLGGVGLELERGVGTPPGTIGQTITTEVGKEYQFIFSATGNFSSGDPIKHMRASAGGVSHDYAIEDTGVYETYSFTFTATETSTDILLQGLRDTGYGAIVSDVRVLEIPAAVSTILNNDSSLSYDAATGKFYRAIDSFVTPTGAINTATSATLNGISGQLVTVGTAYENELIRGFAQQLGADIYLGATDRTTEGDWYFLDRNSDDEQFSTGSTAEAGYYTNWLAGEPNGGAGENYLAVRQSDGVWIDVGELANRKSVIEWDASEVLSNFTFTLTDDAGGRFAIDQNTGEITVADGSLLDYETATSHDVTVQVTDAAGNNYSEAMTITLDDVTEVNLQQTVPGAQNVNEDTTLTFSTGNGNAVSVSDGLVADSELQVTLSVNDGVLTLSQTTGITFVEGAQGSGSMIINGTESALNAAFEGMTFTPNANFSGAVTLNMQTVIAAGLQGHYVFEGGNANDQSAGINQSGSLVGDANTIIDGTRGEVLNLQGTSDYVQIESRFGEPSDITLAAWVNLDSAIENAEVISIGNNLMLRADDIGNGLSLFYYTGSSWNVVGSSSTNLDGAGWNHVAATFDDTNDQITVYLNGEVVATTSTSDSIDWTDDSNTSSHTTIGAHGNSSTSFDFQGQIDDARIYTKALNVNAIKALASDQTSTSTDTINITVNSVNDAPTFDAGDGARVESIATLYDGAVDVAIQPDGKVVMLTSANTASSGQDIDFVLTRYNADGSLDSSFGSGGSVITAVNTNNEAPTSIALQTDGKILVAGGYSTGASLDSIVMRYNTDGTLDTTFSGDGMVENAFAAAGTDYIQDMLVQDDGKIVVVGYASISGTEEMVVARLNTDGTLDTSFNSNGFHILNISANDDRAYAVALQDDGKFVLVGQSDNNGNNDLAVIRLNADGSFDNTFDSDGISLINLGGFDYGASVAIDTSGNILVAGETTSTGSGDSFVLRLTSTGNFDTSFGTGGLFKQGIGSPFESVNDMALQADGKIVVVGDAYNGSNDVSIFRLNTNGTLDTSFDSDGIITQDLNGSIDSAAAVAIDSDGSIVVVGDTTIGGQGDSFVARYNSDGSAHQGFHLVNTLDGNPTFVEDGPAVVLDANVEIYDEELSAADNFSGATLTLERNGGVSTDDDFFFNSGNGLTFTGTAIGVPPVIQYDIQKNGQDIASFDITTTPGQLVITFTDANGEIPTNTDVNNILRQITYSNSNDAPPASVTLDWTFNDGNSGAQGSGGAQQAIGSTVVNIVDVPNAADVVVPIAQSIDEDTPLTFSAGGGNAITVDSGSSYDPILTVTLSVNDGDLTLAGTTGITFLDGTSDGTATVTIAGTETDINNALNGLQYQGDLNYNGSDTLTVTTGSDASVEANLHARYEFLNGSLEDETANNYDGTASGDPTLTNEPERGDVLTFDGDDQIDITNSVSTLGDQVTIAGWVNLDAGQQDNVFLSIGDEFYVILDNSNPSLSMGLHVNGFTTSSLSSANNIAGEGWNHVAATFNDITKETHLYLNGELVRSSTYSFSDVDWSAPDSPNITLGAMSDGSNSFTGSLDDIRVYNSELNRSEIIGVMGDNGYDSETINVTINSVNDEQVLATNTGATVAEGSTGNIVTTAMLHTTDVDDVDSDLTYTLDSAPANGTLYRNSVALSVSDSFKQADIDAGIITYDHDGSQTSADSFDFTVDDGEGTTTSDTFNWAVTNVNDAAVVANTEGTALAYTENDGAVAITSSLTLSDVDDTNLELAVVRINSNYVNGEDVLSFVDQNGISGSWDASTGRLTLTGTATVAEYQAALRSVTYNNTSENPNTATRTIAFAVNDGDVYSNNETRDVTVASVNDAPVLVTDSGTLSYTENDPATIISPGITVTDTDSADYDGGVLTVQVTGNPAAEDRLYIQHVGNNPGEVSIGGGNVSYSGTVVGTYSSAAGGAPLTVTFNSNADQAAVEAIAQNIQYFNVSEDPSTNTRTVSFTLTDGDGGTSTTQTRDVSITAVNDEQVLATNTGTTVTQYSTGNIITTAMLHTTDIDNTDAELIYIIDTAATRGTLYNNGVALGVTDTFTQADIDAGLITYDHNNLFTTADTFDFRVNDGAGSSTADTFTINVNNVNDATTISLVEGADLNYTENDGAVNITSTLTLVDVDDINLESAVVQISGNYVNGEDILSFTDQNGISGSWDAATGTMTLTGTASVANYQTALRSIEYTNTSQDPSNATRTVSFTVNDGDTNSNTQTRDITVTPVNDLPVIDLNGADGAGVNFSATYTEGNAAVLVVDTDALIGDVDNNSYQNLTISLGGFVDGAAERIYINGNAFDYGSANLLNTTIGSTTFDITFTGTAFTITNQSAGNIPEADLTGLLRSIAYENTSADPTISARTFTFNVTDSDGGTSSTPAVSTISINGINTAPSGSDGTVTTNEDTDYVFTSSDFGFTDTDGNTFTNVIITTVPTNGVLYLDSNSDGIVDGGETISATDTVSVSDITSGLLKFKAVANANGVAYDSFTFQVQDDGGTASGGVDTDQTPNTITVDVTAVNDAAVVNINNTDLNFTEQSPVGIAVGATITDVDDTDLESMTVRFTAGYENGVDSFNWTPHAGISGNWDSATGTLTFTGTATVADYQSLLRTITFVNNSDNPDTTTRTFEVFVNDGGVNSTAETRNIIINRVNDNPVFDLDADDSSGGATGNHLASFTEGDSPVSVIDSDVSITDADNTTLDNVAMIGQFNGSSDIGEEIYSIGGEQFVIGTARNTTVTVGTTTFELDFDGSALDINLDSGSGVISDFEGLLATMTYEHTGDNPTTGVRSFSLLVTDADSGSSNTVTSVINVSAVNDPPVVDLNGSDGAGLNYSDTFTEGGGAVNVTDSDATVSDPDDVNFSSIGVNIIGTTDGTAEEITIGGYTFQYGVADIATRTVGGTDFELDFDGSGFTIAEVSSGNIPQVDADALIRSIQYENTSNDPTAGNRTFDISIQDTSGLNSASSFSTITVAAVNDAPVISINSTGAAYTENLGGVFIDAAATIADVDSINFDTGVLTFSPSANGTTSDQLYIQPLGTGPGEVSLSGSDIIIDSVVVGSFSGGTSGTNLVITFNANADATDVQAVTQRVAYSNNSENPSTLTRTVEVTLTDGDGGTSNTGTRNIDINAINDEQTLDNNTGDTVSEGSTGNIITNVMLQTRDVDNTNAELIYTVDTIPLNGTLYNNGTALNATDTFTQADINAGLITYNHDGSQTAADSFDFTVDDGAGTAISDTFNWTITNVNDATSIFGVEGTNLNFTENDAATQITSTLTLSDVDDTHLESAVVQISSNYVNGEDILTFANQNGITGVWDNSTGTLTLSGTATIAEYQTALRSITYTNNSDAPDTNTRTVSFTVNDGDSNSNTQTRDIDITAVNDDPVIGFVGGNINYTENDPATIIDNSTTLTDIDLVDFNGGVLSVYFSANGSGNDRLAINHEGMSAGEVGVTSGPNEVYYGGTVVGNWSGSGAPLSITFNSNADANAVEAVMQNITYQNLSDDPSTATRTIEMQLTDGDGGNSNIINKDVIFTAVNDAPTIASNTGATVSEGSVNNVVTTAMLNEGDPDDDGVELTYTVTSVTTNGTLYNNGTILNLNDTFTQADIDAGLISYTHDGGESIADSFDFSLADGGEDGAVPATGTFNFTVTPVNDAPTVATNTGITVNEGSNNNVITNAMLNEGDVDDAGAGITYTVTSVSSNGTLLNNGVALGVNDTFTQADIDAGLVTYNHDGSENFTDSFGFRISDGGEDGAGTVDDVFNITITPVNDPPIATDDSSSVNEGATVTINLIGNDSDVDNAIDPTSITIVGGPSNGSIVINGDGTVDYTHDGSETMADAFAYTIRDVSGQVSNTATVTLSINPVNDAPVANPDNAVVNEGGSIVIDLLANDSDAEGPLDPNSVDILITPGNGILVNNNDGTVEYFHDGSETTLDNFTYTVRDVTGVISNSTTVNITINPINDAPDILQNELRFISGTTTAMDSSAILATDVDTLDTNLTFTATLVSNGQFEEVANPGVAITNFTQQQINDGEIQFVHFGGAAPYYELTVFDGGLTDGPVVVSLTEIIPTGDPDNPILINIEATPPDFGQPDVVSITLEFDGPDNKRIELKLTRPVSADAIDLNSNGPNATSDTTVETLNLVSDGSIYNQGDTGQSLTARLFTHFSELRDIGIEKLNDAGLFRGQHDAPVSFDQALQDFRREMELSEESQNSTVKFAADVGKTLGLSLSVGSLTWLLRIEWLFSVMLSSMPAWRSFDPLPVLAASGTVKRDEEDLSEEEYLERLRNEEQDREIEYNASLILDSLEQEAMIDDISGVQETQQQQNTRLASDHKPAANDDA